MKAQLLQRTLMWLWSLFAVYCCVFCWPFWLSPMRRSGTRPIKIQTLLSLNHSVSLFFAILLELTLHKIIREPSEQPAIVCRQTCSTQEVDLSGPGSVPLNSTSNHTTTQHNSVLKRARDRSKWCQLVETAMLFEWCATRWWWWFCWPDECVLCCI